MNSSSRITLENNGTFRPQPDQENTLARATGGGNGTADPRHQRTPAAAPSPRPITDQLDGSKNRLFTGRNARRGLLRGLKAAVVPRAGLLWPRFRRFRRADLILRPVRQAHFSPHARRIGSCCRRDWPCRSSRGQCRWCSRRASSVPSNAQRRARSPSAPSSAGRWPATCARSSAAPWASCDECRRRSRASRRLLLPRRGDPARLDLGLLTVAIALLRR